MNRSSSTPPAAGEAAHTPTPWKVTQSGRSYFIDPDYEPHGEVCQISEQDPQQDGNRSEAIEKANAAFIVRAVNSHAALVAALEIAHSALMGNPASEPAVIKTVRAALDAAKEGSK